MSSILLYLACNVLISRSSLMSRDSVMNTSEPTFLLFFVSRLQCTYTMLLLNVLAM